MKKLRAPFLKNLSLKAIIIDLFVVFCGVYVAFYLNDRAEQAEINRQSKRIVRSLKLELEQMRIFFPEQSDYMDRNITEWEKMLEEENWAPYYNWRFLAPQYNYTVLEYALNERETKVLDFTLYKALMDLYRNILQLEEAERYMTEVGKTYTIGVTAPSTDPEIILLRNQNLFQFRRFILFARDRASSLDQVASLAELSLDMINAKFSRQELIEITIEMSQMYIDRGSAPFTMEVIAEILATKFSYFTEEERSHILSQLKFE